jgi:hypothetical protein
LCKKALYIKTIMKLYRESIEHMESYSIKPFPSELKDCSNAFRGVMMSLEYFELIDISAALR